ncbi:hypothetical protein BDV18DRAFT_116628 [Aspergillus unguis]
MGQAELKHQHEECRSGYRSREHRKPGMKGKVQGRTIHCRNIQPFRSPFSRDRIISSSIPPSFWPHKDHFLTIYPVVVYCITLTYLSTKN